MPKIPQIRISHILAIAPKSVGNKVNFLPRSKYQIFLRIDGITLGVCSLSFPKYQVCNVLAISQGKRRRWNWFFACRYTSKFFLNWYYHLSVARHAQIAQNNKFAISLKSLERSREKLIFCILRKNINYLISSVENKKLCIQKVTGNKFFLNRHNFVRR